VTLTDLEKLTIPPLKNPFEEERLKQTDKKQTKKGAKETEKGEDEDLDQKQASQLEAILASIESEKRSITYLPIHFNL